MSEVAMIEKFTDSDLANLRNELMKSRIDSWQAADFVAAFLAGRGYGVNANAMRKAVARMAILSGSREAMQKVLETVAYVM
jgi:hypothetical protein